VREGFRADVADACYVGICGGDEWVWERHVEGLAVDFVHDGLDRVFWRLFAEKGEDFLTFLCEGGVWYGLIRKCSGNARSEAYPRCYT